MYACRGIADSTVLAADSIDEREIENEFGEISPSENERSNRQGS